MWQDICDDLGIDWTVTSFELGASWNSVLFHKLADIFIDFWEKSFRFLCDNFLLSVLLGAGAVYLGIKLVTRSFRTSRL